MSKPKRPLACGSVYEMLLVKLYMNGLNPDQAYRELKNLGYDEVTEQKLNYYYEYFKGRFKERYEEICKIHRAKMENKIIELKKKITKDSSTLEQINFYIMSLNTEIDIIRYYSADLDIRNREDILEKLIARVQSLLELKNKYLEKLDAKYNIRKIIKDVVKIAIDNLLYESLSPEIKKQLLDKFSEEMKIYAGFLQ